MLAAEHYPDVFADAVLPKHELLEIHRSKISRHHSKAGYDYPTIRLPHSFSNLAGLSTRIYQTAHDGALAFLVVVSQSRGIDKNELKENEAKSSKKPVNALRKLQSNQLVQMLEKLSFGPFWNRCSSGNIALNSPFLPQSDRVL